MDSASDGLEQRLHGLWEQHRYEDVATAALEQYGPSILGLQIKLLRDPVAGGEAFSVFCEDLWKGLPGFQWRSSLRTWCFTLARNATHRQRAGTRPDRQVSLEQGVLDVAERVRTRTLAYLRTQARDGIDELRATLTPEDQLLLTLRIEQRMSFKDLAVVTLGDAEPAALTRESARLRKRFQLVKARLRALAEEKGLLGD